MAAVDYITLAYFKTADETADNSLDTTISQLISAASSELNSFLGRNVTPPETGVTKRFRVDAGPYVVDLAPFDLTVTDGEPTITSAILHPESANPQTLIQGTDFAYTPDYYEGSSTTTDGAITELWLSTFLVPWSDYLQRFGFMQLDITGNWGWPSIPEKLQQACVVAVKSWLRRDGGELALVDVQSGRQLQPDMQASYALPPAAKRLASSYQRHAGGIY